MFQDFSPRMSTRVLEDNKVIRCTVDRAELIESGERYWLLKTHAPRKFTNTISSADPEMMTYRERAREGDEHVGRVRIDLVSDRIIRVRYAEAEHVPDNHTHMLVGELNQPCDIHGCEPSDEAIVVRTACMVLTIRLNPYRLVVTTPGGEPITGVGGPEKDYFCRWDSFNTGICRPIEDADADAAAIATESFDLHHGHCVYGLGEKFIQLDKVGQTVDLNMTDGMGVITPRTYKNVPFYVTTQGYGVYFNHSSLLTFWVGSMSAADVQVGVEDDFLDYFVMVGQITDVLNAYTDLTGKSCMPPAWSFGYWQSKISYRAADEVLDIATKLRENNVPCDVIHLDTHWFKSDWYCNLEFDNQRFPDPVGFMKKLREMGIKVSLWQLSYIPSGSKYYDDLAAVDGFVKNADGTLFNTDSRPGHMTSVIDFTNPKAVEVYQRYLAGLFQMGASVIKTDFGEWAPGGDAKYHDGGTGRKHHNLYPLLYNKAAAEVTERETGCRIVWARSAWAGSQRYPIHWGGDNSPNFPNMAPQVDGGLSLGLSGFPFWSHDIGGFIGDTNDRLLIRWMQMGMFMSHSRIHGGGDREVYKYQPETLRICRNYIQLRYRMLPYILGQAMDCVAKSLPMLRAMPIEYQYDRNTWRLSDQYLFGSGLLVAPIMNEGTRRQVYLPDGVWTDWWTGRRIAGPRWMDVEADIETIPLYIREGAVVAMGPVMNYVDEKPVDHLDLRIGRFESDDHRQVTAWVNGKPIRIAYSSENNCHVVTLSGEQIDVAAELVGGGECAVAWR